MIVLFTDFGPAGPYVGQMKAVLARKAPGMPVIDLVSDASAFNARACSYLLAALAPDFPRGAVFLAVVDPGVGSNRPPIVVKTGGQWFVGPDNGLFDGVVRRAGTAEAWRITLQPERLSASFHGRDLFAPVAAIIATGGPVPGERLPPDSVRRADWPDDLPEIIYIDHFGNAMTGLRAASLHEDAVLEAAGHRMSRARVFSDVAPGAVFWYENANGLAEIAVNQGRADRLGLEVGVKVTVSPSVDASR
jgi:hypothetical protein